MLMCHEWIQPEVTAEETLGAHARIVMAVLKRFPLSMKVFIIATLLLAMVALKRLHPIVDPLYQFISAMMEE